MTSDTPFILELPLDKSNADVRVNFLQHHEYDSKTGDLSKRFSWVADIEIDRSMMLLYQQAGRSSWRIENEAFSAIKNQD